MKIQHLYTPRTIWPGACGILLLALGVAHGQMNSVSGSVLEAGTSQPLAAVSIKMVSLQLASGATSAATEFSTKSGTDGSFAFSYVAAGTYLVTPKPPPGYSGGRAANFGRQVVVARSNSIRGLRLVMYPEKTIRGNVVDEGGKGISGAMVRAFAETRDPARGMGHLLELSSVTTDGSGSFALSGLAGNGFLLLATPRREAAKISDRPKPDANLTDQVGLTAAFWPSEPSIELATPLTVHGSSADEIIIVLRQGPLYSIAGHIEGDPGAVRGRAIGVSLVPANSRDTDLTPLGQSAVPGADGSFHFEGLSSGTYLLLSTSSRMGDPVASQSVTVGSGSNEVQIVLHTQPAVELAGKVTVEGAEGLDLSGVSLQLLPLAPRLSGVIPVEVRAGFDGKFAIRGLEPIRYFFRITPAPGTYVKEADLGGRALTGHIIDLSSAGGELSVVLNTGAGSLRGSVRGSEDESGVVLAVIYRDKSADDEPVVVFVKAGSFSVTGLAPGHYYALAARSYDPDLFGNPEFRRRISRSIVAFEVAENQATAIGLPLLAEPEIMAAAFQANLL